MAKKTSIASTTKAICRPVVNENRKPGDTRWWRPVLVTR